MSKGKSPPSETTLKKTTYYKGSVTVGKKANGKPARIYVRGKTEQERDEKKRRIKNLYDRGLDFKEITVNEWSDRWMAIYKANVSGTQKDHYRVKLKDDILPVIGSLRMRDIRLSHIQELLNKYSGKKKGTVEKIRNALRQLFADAEVEGIIERNPAARLELPMLEEKPRRPLTETERDTVLKVATKHPSGAYVLTMLYTGVRRGECIALERSDIDLERRRITVSKELNLRRNIGTVEKTKAAKMRKKRVKSDEDAGVRFVPIPDVLIPVMTQLCEGKQGNDILFPKSDGKRATKQTVTWWWKSFARQCHIEAGAELHRNAIKYETSPFGEELTPHYLRHTYATDLYAAGIDEKARKEFLGHASSDVTDTYTAMNNDAFNRAARLLNEYYRKSGADSSQLQEAVDTENSHSAALSVTGEKIPKYDTVTELFEKLGI